MPNLEPWMNQQSEEESIEPSKFENHLLSIKDEHHNQIRPNYIIRHIMNDMKRL